MHAERAAFSAFAADLASALHAAGKTLSFALPAVTSRESVYDYDALSTVADQLHIMGYDYHYAGGPHAGPIAPLAWVRDTLDYVENLDGGQRASRFILALPNYGIFESPDGETGDCEPLARCFDAGSARYATTIDEDASYPGEDRDASFNGRSPNVTLKNGDHLFFEDIRSLEEKVQAAAERGLGGIGYWSLGGEPEGADGRSFFAMVRGHYPER
jgi:chitinase